MSSDCGPDRIELRRRWLAWAVIGALFLFVSLLDRETALWWLGVFR